MTGFAYLLKFSYRNLFRVPKRTIIMILSLSFGCGFIIWDLNFANSGSREIMKGFLAQYAGQYHITNLQYYDAQNKKKFDLYKTMSDDDLEDKSLIEKSTRRVNAPVFISGEKKTLGVLLSGLEVEKERKLSTLYSAITVGKYLNKDGSKEIILGKKLAQRINVNVGEEVAVIGQALDGSIANDLFTVVGLLDFGGGDLEESLAFTQLTSAQELLAMPPDRFHQRVSFDMEAENLPVLKNLQASLWSELLPEIGVAVKFIDNFTWIVSVIIVVVVSLGLSNTLMITFFEREAEFTSLNIIGAKTSWITASLMIEVFIMGTIAVFVGSFFGFLGTTYFHYYPINIEIFTGGKPIIMGGMTIAPMIKLYSVPKYYWQVPLMIYFFLILTMVYPLVRVIRRSKNAI
jgi:ABC-type lipoprotein release transport system permease subunit